MNGTADGAGVGQAPLAPEEPTGMESNHLSHRRRDGDCSDPTAIRHSLHTRLVNSLVPLLKKRASGEDRRGLAGSTFGRRVVRQG